LITLSKFYILPGHCIAKRVLAAAVTTTAGRQQRQDDNYNELWAGGRQDMPPTLSSPVGAEAPCAAEQTAT